MLIPFGILSAAGAGVAGGDYELIETQVLGTAVSEVTFSSLATYASTYKHLQVRYTTRSTRAAIADNLGVRFNGITSASYSHHRIYADGSTVAAFNGASATFMLGDSTTAASATANVFSAGVIDILDAYSTTKNKTIRILCGHALSGHNAIELVSGAFYNTASLTSFSLFALTGNVVAGTRVSLYGLKA